VLAKLARTQPVATWHSMRDEFVKLVALRAADVHKICCSQNWTSWIGRNGHYGSSAAGAAFVESKRPITDVLSARTPRGSANAIALVMRRLLSDEKWN